MSIKSNLRAKYFVHQFVWLLNLRTKKFSFTIVFANTGMPITQLQRDVRLDWITQLLNLINVGFKYKKFLPFSAEIIVRGQRKTPTIHNFMISPLPSSVSVLKSKDFNTYFSETTVTKQQNMWTVKMSSTRYHKMFVIICFVYQWYLLIAFSKSNLKPCQQRET